ncbi:MAG TPA: GFA family protein [Aliidongia sp.]|uniref:GFA family protein n=1 Tax=Aliidongia sp. TaxID=1914230 RepID=UPI002DDD0291|nr:GFA family protein [Aliidongia sp.]HEV2674647.1 GFA family protein [Aliidongia sp.]
MSAKTHKGSCHCGAVRFEVDLDLGAGTMRCNCSLCTKVRSWFAIVEPERFRLIQGADAQTEYSWTPPGRPGPNLHFQFCRICGIRTPGNGEHGPDGGPFVFIPVGALDDASPDDLVAAIHYIDGRHDRDDLEPEDIRAM